MLDSTTHEGGILATALWNIWKARNAVIFAGTFTPANILAVSIIGQYNNYEKACGVTSFSGITRSSSPSYSQSCFHNIPAHNKGKQVLSTLPCEDLHQGLNIKPTGSSSFCKVT